MSSFTRKRVLQVVLLTVSIFLFLGADSDARFRMLGHKMMCVCGCNQVLLECNHVGCAYSDRMRGELATYVERGDSDDLTLQAFVQKYGPTVLIAPTTEGFNKVAWIVPYAALVLGIAAVCLIVRSWRSRPTPALADGISLEHGPEIARFRDQARKETDQ